MSRDCEAEKKEQKGKDRTVKQKNRKYMFHSFTGDPLDFLRIP